MRRFSSSNKPSARIAKAVSEMSLPNDPFPSDRTAPNVQRLMYLTGATMVPFMNGR